MTMVGRGVVASCVIALLVACSGSKESGAKFDSVRVIAQALSEAGLGCSDLTTDSGVLSTGAIGSDDSTDRGRCTLEGDPIIISVYEDASAQADAERQHEHLACASPGAGSPTGFNFAKGSKWDVTTSTQSQADKIANALGGLAVHEDFGCPTR